MLIKWKSSKRKLRRKAQVFSSDVVLSLVVFLFLTSISFYLWEKTYDKSSYFGENSLIRQRLFQITDLMVRTSGYPKNWTRNNVKIIGFASKDHILQKNKIYEFMNMSNHLIKDKLRIRGYNFFLNLTAEDLIFIKGKIWNESATSISGQTRMVLVNDSNNLKKGTLRLYLWK